MAIEAEAGKTPSGDALDAIVSLAGLLPERESASMLRMAVYGGDSRQDREKGLMLPWREIDAVDWESGDVARPRRR